MLKHIPLGLGHPYRTEPFERVPHYPVALKPIKLRVCTTKSQKNVIATLQIKSGSHEFPMHSVGNAMSEDLGVFGTTAKELVSQSHLSDAAERSGEYSEWLQWEVEIPGHIIAHDFEYFFSSENEVSEIFSVLLSRWVSDCSHSIITTGPVLPLSGIEWLVDSKGTAHTLHFNLTISENNHVVGLGERFHSVDQLGELVDAVVYEEYKGQGHRTYLPTPFLNIIGASIGLHLNTSNPSRFSIGARDKSLIEIEVDLCVYDTVLEINSYSGTPTQVLKQYLDQVGLPAAPPDWIYSLWISSNEWNTQERVQREIAECFSAGIKPGVVVIEAWSDESTFTVFRDAQYPVTDGLTGLKADQITYPEDGAWPNPRQMIDELHNQDLRLILWQIPIIKEIGDPGSQAEVNWNYAIDNNLVVRDSHNDPYRVRGFWFRDGLLPDLTDSKVRKWWAEQRRYLVTELGVDGFKTDGGEHAWGQDLLYLDGTVGLEKNNTFPVHYAQTFHDLLKESGKDTVTFSRAGFTGSQKYPSFWAGDENSTWAAYRASINAGITASASGFFHWGWDIGGFSGDLPSPELYLRGTAMATFCPIMQIHSEFNHHKTPSNDRTPWNLARRYNDPVILETFRKFAQLREELLPYLSYEGKLALVTGRPLMAGLFFDFYDDPEIWSVPSEYMLGTSILVAPVTQPGVLTQNIYLPKGEWVSFWNDEEFSGEQWVQVPAPLDQIPAFILKDRADEIKNR
ncbi:MAG: glycoside hydrolase family 31 [Actinobacteria bacterium]|uniref:Unannotated protein n=1 Tax=freshwater metagenome TaxID=449393 RepID=A0A6J7TLL9_9ZZZZ|nr:glycoside hydrolase family 31 [Actinomycetota bacterium]MSY48675.1 glycoside hydrolase family 31 [Actinomycetota bacterium]MTH91732.1 glycoside hydrolase family 31 [Actinomycetota bacterium]